MGHGLAGTAHRTRHLLSHTIHTPISQVCLGPYAEPLRGESEGGGRGGGRHSARTFVSIDSHMLT